MYDGICLCDRYTDLEACPGPTWLSTYVGRTSPSGWIVKKEWLEDCYAHKKRQPEHGYGFGGGGGGGGGDSESSADTASTEGVSENTRGHVETTPSMGDNTLFLV